MATRRGGGGGGGAATPPAGGGVWPVFEDFKPTSEWLQDSESNILNIYLPGFAKEQLRVSTEGRDVIRVRGERLVAGNKWNRFLEDYEVPRGSDMNSVRAKFQGGILTITVKKTSADMTHDVHPPKAAVAEAPKQPTPQKGRDESPPAVNKTADLRTTQGQPDDSRDARSSSPFRNVGQVLPQESNKLRETHIAPKQTNDATKKLEKNDSSETNKELPAGETTVKEKIRSDPQTSKTSENNRDLKEKQTLHSKGHADHNFLTVEKYKKAVQGLSELNEDRKLLVNMGVAVLVVMAITAYATYKFTSGKDQK
ncbi:inactive protein RESTRICTED TEV MOVEMENT 2-like [Andrographis paniculata]|uniref:inactive protein RESTRICTED TEV MOVEMENT 2-like n=1 Tax=Andrographis paniculata TaxID=175694 RepID=UPI0021E71270|nr:inactive protein RESTRICTED TEV MOVEMENT 2-like [Andrographis paniculata]